MRSGGSGVAAADGDLGPARRRRDTGVYDQSIPSDGYGYLTTRDGTKLAINVHPPQDVSDALPVGVPLPPLPKLPDGVGATPTLIEYSGYGYADPAGPQSGIAIIANLMGFTVVDVNMRGTGCSGGAFDFFEPLQGLDGYDVDRDDRAPAVGRAPQGRDDGHLLRRHQPAVHRAAAPAEPGRDLAAVGDRQHADDAVSRRHPQHRLRGQLGQGARPRRAAGVGRAAARRGRTSGSRRATRPARPTRRCTAEAVNLLAKIRANNHYVPKVADPLAPVTFVNKINVPTYMACQWTDEQTGGHCPTLAEHFTRHARASGSRSPTARTSTRSTRRRSTAGSTSSSSTSRRQAPSTNAAAIRARRARRSTRRRWAISGVTLPPDPIQEQPTYAGALAAFEQLPPIRVLFDNGAGGSSPGQPLPGFEQSFAASRSRARSAQTWYLAPSGGARQKPKPEARAPTSSRWNAARAAADRLHRRHRGRQERAVDGDAALPLGAEPGRHRRRPT